MKIIPLGARILIKYEKPVDVKKGGLLLSAGSINPNYFTGTVVHVGPEVEAFDATKVGAKVAFLKYGYEDMGDELYLVEEMSVIAVLEE